jgi:hypothetical protein
MESSSHRRVSRWIAWALAAGLTLPVATLAAAGAPQNGTFALLGGTAEIVSKMTAKPSGAGYHLDIKQYATGSSTAIRDYSVEMQRTIHLIAVRDDFTSFSHSHPAFNTGTNAFVETLPTDPGHHYFVFVDTKPVGMSEQVFRFNVGPSNVPAMGAMRPHFAPSAPQIAQAAGPYAVTISESAFPANTEQTMHVTVKKGEHLANDLGLYLGAPAHCVFVNTSTLQYVHTHAMVRQESGMAMQVAGPEMTLDVPPLPAGTYKLWIEFRGANYGLYTAPFTVVAQ